MNSEASVAASGAAVALSRDVWVERLQAYQAHLEQELQNVRDVIERLGPEPPEQTEPTI